MEEQILNIKNRIVERKSVRIVLDLIFVLGLAVMAFIKVNRGIDITDSSYSCTNFYSLESLDGMWFFSTFYANLLGHLFTLLPLGGTFLGLNIYTALIKFSLAIVAYFFFTKAVKADALLTFVTVLASLALCWCPTTILYNYLSYFLFLLGAVFLYLGLVKEKTILLVVAGFFLGSNVFVRLPNVIEAGLIVALWLYCFVQGNSFKEGFMKTIACIEGYIFALIPGFILIQLTRGFSEYLKGIKELFEMTDESTSYTAAYMVLSILRQYIETCKYAWIAAVIIVLAALIFRFVPEKLQILKYVLVSVLCVLCVYLLYKRGLFDLNFAWFGPVYRYGAMILMFAIVSFFVTIFSKNMTSSDKLLAAISLMVIAITPIGSNNDIYSNLNNLFFVLPAFAFVCFRLVKTSDWMRGVRVSVSLFFLGWFLLCLKFGTTYVFRDGANAPMDTQVYNNPQMAGMKTEKANAERLTELSDVWFSNGLDNGKSILFGDVCGLSFYMNTPVAISTAWPTLASFSIAKFDEDIKELSIRIDEGIEAPPSIVISAAELEKINAPDRSGKQEILNNFIHKLDYNVLYTNDVLTVLTVR